MCQTLWIMAIQIYPARAISDKNNQLDDCSRSSAISMLFAAWIFLRLMNCHHHHHYHHHHQLSRQTAFSQKQVLNCKKKKKERKVQWEYFNHSDLFFSCIFISLKVCLGTSRRLFRTSGQQEPRLMSVVLLQF